MGLSGLRLLDSNPSSLSALSALRLLLFLPDLSNQNPTASELNNLGPLTPHLCVKNIATWRLRNTLKPTLPN